MKTSIIFSGNHEDYMDYWEITATINPIINGKFVPFEYKRICFHEFEAITFIKNNLEVDEKVTKITVVHWKLKSDGTSEPFVLPNGTIDKPYSKIK